VSARLVFEALIPFAAGHELIRQRRRDRWVYGVPDWKGFLAALGAAALDAIRVKTPRLSESLDYGA